MHLAQHSHCPRADKALHWPPSRRGCQPAWTSAGGLCAATRGWSDCNWGGIIVFSHPRGLLLPCSEHGSAYWLRVGQAGVNMSEASGKPPSAWEEGPHRLDARGWLIRVICREAGCMAGAGASRPPFGVLWSQLPIRDEDMEVRRLSE